MGDFRCLYDVSMMIRMEIITSGARGFRLITTGARGFRLITTGARGFKLLKPV